MAVTQTGASAIATATTGSVTASTTARTGTLPRTAGHLLVAVVQAIATTSVGTITTTSTGWTAGAQKVGEAVQTLCHTAVYWKTATGADAAPVFTSALSGTYQSMKCVLYELAGQHPTTPVATYGTGTGTGNIATLNTAGNVPSVGCYAVGAHAVYTGSNATDAWTKAAAWTADTTDAATARFHHAWNIYPGPPAGALLSFLGTWATAGTGQSAMEAVIQPVPDATATPATAAVTTSQPAVHPAETSPALELSGFGTFTGISPGDVIDSVTVTVGWFGATAGMAAPVLQLWNGTSAQIGASVTGTVSTDPVHTDTATFTGVTYAQLRDAAAADIRRAGRRPAREHILS